MGNHHIMSAARHLDCDCSRLNGYRTYLTHTSSPNTSRTWNYLVTRTYAELGNRIHDRAHIKRYLDKVKPQGKPTLINALRSYYSWCVAQGLLERDPLELRAVPQQAGRPPRSLERDELEKLIAAASTRGEIGPRLADAITLQAMTGMRPGELLALKVEDFNFDRNLVTVYGSKVRRYRTVPLNPRARQAAERLCDGKQGRILGWVTTHYNGLVKQAGKLAGLPPARIFPYALRHTCATLLLREAKVDIEIVREILGHTSLQHTLAYVRAEGTVLKGALDAIS